MTPLRIVVLACIAAACSRDSTRDARDSLSADRLTSDSFDTGAGRRSRDTAAAAGDTIPLAESQITVERVVINGILWGAAEEEVQRVLGAPQSTSAKWEEALGDTAVVLAYPGMTVRTVERRVVGVNCTGQSCITADAVRVGATRAEVEQVYGKGKEERAGPNGQLAYFFTTDNACALRFELSQGKVRTIDASCLMN
jgi:hypothetical protein